MTEASASANEATGWVRLAGLTRSFIKLWAVGFGGSLLVVIVLLTAYSAASGFLLNKPIAGDFEIVQFGIAIAAFSFLPLCQITRANVVVDSFTLWTSPRAQMMMNLLGSLIALVFAAVLLWRMSIGLVDYYHHEEYTAIIGIPLWWAFPPMLFSLLLLFVGALITTAEILGLLPGPSHAGTSAGRE